MAIIGRIEEMGWDELGDEAVDGLLFRVTDNASPEQYDVFDGRGRQVGYVRLRRSRFTVNYRACGGKELVRRYDWPKELNLGQFGDDAERRIYLGMAAEAIKAEIRMERQMAKDGKRSRRPAPGW